MIYQRFWEEGVTRISRTVQLIPQGLRDTLRWASRNQRGSAAQSSCIRIFQRCCLSSLPQGDRSESALRRSHSARRRADRAPAAAVASSRLAVGFSLCGSSVATLRLQAQLGGQAERLRHSALESIRAGARLPLRWASHTNTMQRPSFYQLPALWLKDGSYRDVYLQGTSLAEWQLFSGLVQGFPHSYRRDGIEHPLPDASTVFADRDHSHLLGISLGNVLVNCHYFVQGEIELDIDPKDVVGPAEHEAFLSFVERVAIATSKCARITGENAQGSMYVQFDPMSQSWGIPELPLGDASQETPDN